MESSVCQYCGEEVEWVRVPFGRFVHAATGSDACGTTPAPRTGGLEPHATVDAAFAVLGHLSREWGDHGYRVHVEGDGAGGAICHVRHTDGSEFEIRSDRWGNIREAALPDDVIAEILSWLRR